MKETCDGANRAAFHCFRHPESFWQTLRPHNVLVIAASMLIVGCCLSIAFEKRFHVLTTAGPFSSPIPGRVAVTFASSSDGPPITRGHILMASQQRGSWIGNTWVPPSPAWKLFDPMELLRMYSGKSILFIGDSTSRRAGQTLFALLEEASQKLETSGFNQSKTAWNALNIDYSTLNDAETLDYNKKETEGCPFAAELENFQVAGFSSLHEDAAGLPDRFPYKHGICHRTPSVSSSTMTGDDPTPIFAIAVMFCPVMLEAWIKGNIAQQNNMLSRFDVVVLATGVWDAVRSSRCQSHARRIHGKESPLSLRDPTQIAQDTILSIKEYIQSQALLVPSTTSGVEQSTRYPKTPMIVWRTSGYDQELGHNITDEMNQGAIDTYNGIAEIVTSLAQGNNSRERLLSDYFRLVDWGGAIRPRSFHGYVFG
jgi:hypothetical protein